MSIIKHFQKLEEMMEEMMEDQFRLMSLVYDSVDVFKGHKAVAFKEEHPIAIIIKEYYEEKDRKEVEDILKELLDEDEFLNFCNQK